jgi:hypothetical protein
VDVETVLLCDVQADGTVAATVLVEPVYDTTSGARVGTRTVDPATGAPYTVQGTLQPCDGDDCASRTTPVTSVGLCLADGTPIAVTVVRDCEGVVTSEGWINLTTGAWTAGAVPAGTVACGDSRSIQVSGTFCDVDADGEVVGLVLVEYTYDDTGAISSVRLVDAVTGGTYTPTGTVTTCPAGVEQPEQDAVILCDTAADGTVTEFLRDFRRDENGAIVGRSDYHLDGTVYVPTGTVGVCSSPCLNCETLLLCDGGADPATITGAGVSAGTLPNGVSWTARAGAAAGSGAVNSRLSNADGAWWGKPESFPLTTVPTYTFTFNRPSVVEFSVYMAYVANPAQPDDNCMQIPAGSEVVSLPEGFIYDPVTGQVCVTAAQTGDPCVNLTNPTRAASATFRTSGPVSSLSTFYLGARYARCGQFQSSWVGALEVTPASQFLRTICRDCDGEVTSTTDTHLDGVSPFTPLGMVSQCTPTPPCDKTVLGECVYSLPDTATGFDLAAAAFPGCWLGTALNPTYAYGDRVTSWEGTYLSGTGTVSGLGFNSPDLGGDLNFAAFAPAIPADPAESPVGYVGTATIAGVTVTLRALAGNGLSLAANTTKMLLDGGDRVRIEFSEPVRLTVTTSAFADPPTPHNERLCGVVASTVPWEAVKVADCEGVISTVDTATRQPLPATATVQCDDDCCQPVQVCVDATRTESREFISNAANATDNSVDPTWRWSPALTGPWYDMYRTPPVAGWTTQDGGTPAGTAHWVSAHPNGSPVQSNPPRPGEGPTIGVQSWYARATFNLPPAADPASIRIAATVLNADQNLVAWRLNTGAWQPVGADHTEPPTTFGPTAVPGVKPGANEMILHIQETVAGGGGAALMVHLIASYQLPDGQRSWTRMVCCDGTVYYLDDTGARREELPEFWSVAPCGTGSEPVLLCDDAGSFLRHFSYAGDQIVTTDTDLTGEAYTPVGTVRSCSSSMTGPADAPVSTGIRRVTGTAPQNLKTEAPGLQSVSVTVLAGVLNVTMSTGAAQAVPAGMTLTWSVADTDDSSLAAASFAGATAATDYVLNWTAKGSADG